MLPCVGHSLSKEKLFLVNKDGDFMSAVPLTVNSLIIQLAVSFSVCPCPTSLSLSFFFFPHTCPAITWSPSLFSVHFAFQLPRGCSVVLCNIDTHNTSCGLFIYCTL